MRQRLRELEGRLGAVESEKGELERENTLIKALLPPLSPAAQALMSLAAGGTPGGFPGTGRAVQTPPAVRTPARPASDPEQRLARARAEMMRIPRHRRADEDALAEARDRTRRVQQMVEASKTASTTERLETVARATEAFYRGDDDRPTSK